MAGLGGMLQERTRGWQDQADRVERWMAGHYSKLEELVELMRERGEREQYHRLTTSITTDAAGNGNVQLPGRQGSHYEFVSVAVTSVSGEAGALLAYVNGPHPSSLLHVVSLGQYTSDSFPEGTFLPAGVQPYLALVGSVPTTTVYINILAKQLQQVPPVRTIGGGEA